MRKKNEFIMEFYSAASSGTAESSAVTDNIIRGMMLEADLLSPCERHFMGDCGGMQRMSSL